MSDELLQTAATIATGPGFEAVPADPASARDLLRRLQVDEAEGMLFHASRGRWASANSAAYDIARKSLHALLLAVGRRVRSTAGHLPYEQVARRWLPSAEPRSGARIAKAFTGSKKASHAKEYPSPRDVRQSDAALQHLAQDAVRLHLAVCRVLDVEAPNDLVPTVANLARWRADTDA